MTPIRRGSALVALALLLALPAVARAEAYAAISGGVALPTGDTAYGKLETAPAASLAVGYDFPYAGASVWAGFVSTRAGALLQINAVPILARFRGRLPLGIAVPFVYGAVGFAPSRAILNLIQYNTTAFAAQAGGGLDLVFGDMFTLGVEAGWQWLSPTYGFATVKLDGATVLGTLALRFG